MSRDNDLPFARGTTFCEGDTTAIAALGTELEGKVYTAIDAASGQAVRLRIVKNGGASTLTAPYGRGLLPDAGTGYLGRRIDGFIDGAGKFGHVADVEYTGDVVSGDLFYVYEDGYASNVRLGATSVTEGDHLVFDSAGYLVPQSTTEGHIVARAAETVTSTGQGNENVDVQLGGGFAYGYDET